MVQVYGVQAAESKELSARSLVGLSSRRSIQTTKVAPTGRPRGRQAATSADSGPDRVYSAAIGQGREECCGRRGLISGIGSISGTRKAPKELEALQSACQRYRPRCCVHGGRRIPGGRFAPGGAFGALYPGSPRWQPAITGWLVQSKQAESSCGWLADFSRRRGAAYDRTARTSEIFSDH